LFRSWSESLSAIHRHIIILSPQLLYPSYTHVTCTVSTHESHPVVSIYWGYFETVKLFGFKTRVGFRGWRVFSCCGKNKKFRYRWWYYYYYNVLMCIIKLSLDQRAKNKFPSYTHTTLTREIFFLRSLNYIAVDHTILSSYLRSYVMPTHAHRIYYSSFTSYCTLPCGWLNDFWIAIWIPRAQWVGVKAKQFARPQAVYPYYASQFTPLHLSLVTGY